MFYLNINCFFKGLMSNRVYLLKIFGKLKLFSSDFYPNPSISVLIFMLN